MHPLILTLVVPAFTDGLANTGSDGMVVLTARPARGPGRSGGIDSLCCHTRLVRCEGIQGTGALSATPDRHISC